jgi:hypothetical protein
MSPVKNSLRHGVVTFCLFALTACSHNSQSKPSATVIGLPGGAKAIKLKPEDVPTLYSNLPATEQRCEQIAAEIARIDAGLGTGAVETPPAPPATATQRVASYGKGLAVESVKGVVQPLIQTKRAIMNDEAKEKRAAEATARGNIRRAYLKGMQEGTPCQAAAQVNADAQGS